MKVYLGSESIILFIFSCHGISKATNTSESGLLFKKSLLTVSDLTASNIDVGQFAFLSAYHFAGARNVRLLNESITLSSASGYPSVVGTLWQVTAEHSAEIASGGMLVGRNLAIGKAAEKLHHAVWRLREITR